MYKKMKKYVLGKLDNFSSHILGITTHFRKTRKVDFMDCTVLCVITVICTSTKKQYILKSLPSLNKLGRPGLKLLKHKADIPEISKLHVSWECKLWVNINIFPIMYLEDH